jgi:uncharacterized protein YoxC
METWTVVGVVLLAVLVGALLPVLLEAYRTLRVSRRAIDRLEGEIASTLRQVRRAADQAGTIGEALAPHTREVAEVMEAVAGLARPIRELRSNLVTLATWASALAPAIAAAARAYTERETRPASGESDGVDRPTGEPVTSDGQSPS